MARSRRRNRRSTSQNAASLLALALPAPFQRLANSQLGPMLIFFGLPALLIVGFLQIDWQDGTPHLKVNPQKASELKAAVKDHLGNIENQPLIQQWQQAARQSWNSQPPSANSPFPQPQYPQQTTSQPSTGNSAPVGKPQAPFPSTNPPTYVSTQSQPQADYRNYSQEQQQPMVPLQPQYAQQQYAQQQYGQQQYGQQPMIPLQQPYTQPQYTQQQINEQQLYQQRLYEQQLYQQRVYEQQLYQQQLYQQRQQYNQQPPPAPMAQSPSVQPAWRNR